MVLNALTAISPIDGRYRPKVEALSHYFSEYALIRYRILVEIEYFILLAETQLPPLKPLNDELCEKLRSIYLDFTLDQAIQVKEIESRTNHDVKAIEYFLKQEIARILPESEAGKSEFIHFGLTSQDINNVAVPLSFKNALSEILLPELNVLLEMITERANSWKGIAMLAHTHGQPASPTSVGKELKVFAERLSIQLATFRSLPYPAKFGGATGNFNAHIAAYPDYDWIAFANSFIKSLGLERSQTTTQIEHYDKLAALLDNLRRINTLLADFAKDIWFYIHMEYFIQKINSNEVGSSAMPHKVNPIDFENAEGNLGLSSAVCNHLATTLPVSRLQRDLTDSTLLRNLGLPVAHTLIAVKSLIKGLSKVEVNEPFISADLEDNWAIVAEGIQTILRREGYPEPYEALKELTRTGKKITKNSIHEFIEHLKISDVIKNELLAITPHNYTGNAKK